MKALEIGNSLHRGPIGETGGGCDSWGLLRDRWKILEMEPSLWELCEGNLEEGHLYWGPRRICKEGSGNRHLSAMGHCWGTWRGAHLLGTSKHRQRRGKEICKRRLWKWANLSMGPVGKLGGGFIYRGI